MAKPLKFCMVTTFYPPHSFGGDAMYVYRLSSELARQGHQVDVIHCEDAYALLSNNGALGEYPHQPNVRVYGLKSPAGWLSPLLTQQSGVPFFKRQKIKDLLEKNQYDVIHYHNMSLIGITALQYGSAIKLYTTHEHWLVCPMHVLWKFDREVCNQRSCTLCCLQGKRPPQLWRHTGLLERMVKYVDCFISPSRFTLNKHHELGLDIPIRHIPHFLPDVQGKWGLTEVDAPSSTDRSNFLFVGRLEKIKGVQNLIPVFKDKPEYELQIAGEGNYESELRALAGDSRNIKFLGNLNQGELRPLYRKAVAVLVPSVCYETFGMIIIEAFSQRTPVIVNNLGALPEIVQDSGGGFIYDTASELTSAMEQLARDKHLRDELGSKGYEAYLKYWSADAHLEQYLGLIRDLQLTRQRGTDSPNDPTLVRPGAREARPELSR
jgi:glycosyltransferase involved in cell wall biosynthesis